MIRAPTGGNRTAAGTCITRELVALSSAPVGAHITGEFVEVPITIVGARITGDVYRAPQRSLSNGNNTLASPSTAICGNSRISRIIG